jgi:oxalate decarboxylase
LPIATEVAGVNMRLTPGGVRELHWHKAAEWAYMIKGRARITAIDQDGRAFQDDVGEGDLWYFAAGIPHSIQGLEDDGCEFLLVFDDGNFSEEETFLLSDWLSSVAASSRKSGTPTPRSSKAIRPTSSESAWCRLALRRSCCATSEA